MVPPKRRPSVHFGGVPVVPFGSGALMVRYVGVGVVHVVPEHPLASTIDPLAWTPWKLPRKS